MMGLYEITGDSPALSATGGTTRNKYIAAELVEW